MDIDGEGVDHFGLTAHGVHMIGYTHLSSTNETKYWVPRRSWTKKTYPGMLDSTVGGSLRSREKPVEA